MIGARRLRRTIEGATAIALAAALTQTACSASGASRRLAASLDTTIAGSPPDSATAGVWTDVRAFYERRGNAPAWVKPKTPSKRAFAALHLIRRAPDHGLDAADYGEAALASEIDALERTKPNERDLQRRLALLDVRLTAAVLALGRHVALGRTPPPKGSGWGARRSPPDFAALLHEVTPLDPSSWLDRLEPKHQQYLALRRSLGELRDELEQPPRSHDATPPGVPPVEQRIRQVELNLDRWRWMPDHLGDRHFIVNVPGFHLFAREHGRTMLDMKVVVGKPGTETPVFSDEMETVVFSPYWNIPDTIATAETAPAVIRDPSYLERNNIEVLSVSRSGTTRVDPTTIDWENPVELERLAFRQKPGASNALGHVKFLFPNPYHVYLHDTPADSLFNKPTRAFSHGCVRVERPHDLASYVLRDDPDWTDERIRQAMFSGRETPVTLKEKIPVHIVYFTVWVDDDGTAQFLPDVYKKDRA
jgi:murein L,D-transpeptidase YcbB/YkuD